MDTVIHQVIKRRVDHPMSFERKLPGKGGADDVHMEVALALPCMADVEVTLIGDLQFCRGQCIRQTSADLLGHDLTHAGSALRNGLICT